MDPAPSNQPPTGRAAGGRFRALAVIPARLGSTRLPRKMLLRETGRYLFEHTARNVLASNVFERVVIATDADEILAAAAEVGLEAIATSPDHQRGTDRVHEACIRLGAVGADEFPYDVLVNVQGDEPELAPDGLRDLVNAFADPDVELATLYHPLDDAADADDPAVVKLVVDGRGDALYFSRARVPFPRDSRADAPTPLRHVGVYAFRPAALARFCALEPGRLERAESLEQLRWLEAGGRIRCVSTVPHPSGIDTLEQYAAFRARTTESHVSEARSS